MSKKSNQNSEHCRKKYPSVLKDLRNINKIIWKDMVYDREDGTEGGGGTWRRRGQNDAQVRLGLTYSLLP